MYANNKGADQPAHTRRLISAFVIRLFENTRIILSCYMDNFNMMHVASRCSLAGWVKSDLVTNSEDSF